MTRKYKTEEFLTALEAGSLEDILPIEPPTLLSVSGFVKPSDDQNILFSPGLLCLPWIKIPKTIIKEVEYLGKRSCGTHEHDYAKIDLTVPIDNPIITAFAGLAQAYTEAPNINTLASTPSGLGFERLAPVNDFGQNPQDAWAGWRPPRWNPRCAACITGWTAAAAIIAGWAASTGGIGVTLLQGMIVTEFGVSAATAHVAASVAIAGGTTAAIASALCPACR